MILKAVKYCISLLFILLLVLPVWSQQHNVSINGSSDNAEGKLVELYRYSDPLTLSEVLLDSCTIDAQGHFKLSTYTNYPLLVFVQIECYSQSFYIEPGRTYSVSIDSFQWNMDEQRNIHLAPVALPLRFSNLPPDELNLAILRFEALCDSFVFANRYAMDFRYRPQRTYFDSLRHIVRGRDFGNHSDFFNRYVTYHLAQMEYALGFASRPKLFARYIDNKPLLCFDNSYMEFFLSLFSKFLTFGSSKIPVKSLAAWVNDQNLGILLDSLGLEPLLRNEQVRHLVALQTLKEAFYVPHLYNRQSVMALVSRFAQHTKFPDIAQLATNLSLSFDTVASASLADIYSFSLPDDNGRLVSLDTFRGRWLYVAFVRTDSPTCIGEIETMAHFRDTVYKSHPDSVAFLTIACDREPQKMYHLLHNTRRGSHYDWTWLHFNANYKFLEQFQVVSYPYFVLFNPQGKRVHSITPAPSSGFLLRPPLLPRKAVDKDKPFLINEQ